ncbi:MAG TPA: T9SS type A sorting domain-containing protein [Candidatus Limnocylindria bacterium]|nr:T9SS type A sorting domain-containing protein [Candidatus Limnocylindria bacterium]
MAPERCLALLRRAAVLTAVVAATAAPAHALRIVNYNIMFYPSVNVSGRNPYFRGVMGPLGADVVVVQELNSPAGVDSFRNNVLNVLEPGQWASAPYTNGPDSNNGLFYKPARVQFLGSWAWIPPDNLRQVNCYRLKPAGYTDAAAELRVYSLHLKAGDSGADEARRLTDAIGIRDSMNTMPPGSHAILTGDFNVYRSTDLAFQKFLESQADNDGRVYDPLNAVGNWHDGGTFAAIHTQCPSTTSYRPSGSYSGGGVDDRFDMFLPTYNMNNGEGLDLLVSTYIPIGNDGLHLNKSVTDAPIAPADTTYARALWWASDHLPIRVDVQIPAKITAPPTLALGTVIVGGGTDLVLSNPATIPADELTLTFSPPAGFTAPAGTQIVSPGLSSAFAIGTAAGSPGPRAGNLTITTDAPDAPTVVVGLTADVLDHARASLDSSSVVLASLLDFGAQTAGAFSTQLARVHNQGYDALQARLSVTGGGITGGHGRFSIVGGFTPGLVAGVARSYTIAFNDAGATQDSTYEATLTLTSADELLPGAAPQPNLVITLRARPVSGQTDVADGVLPSASRLFTPFPNPVLERATVRFDIAQPTATRIEIYDLAGRRVALLADREFEPGTYALNWNARGEEGGALRSGLYFVRMSGRGLRPQIARLVLAR